MSLQLTGSVVGRVALTVSCNPFPEVGIGAIGPAVAVVEKRCSPSSCLALLWIETLLPPRMVSISGVLRLGSQTDPKIAQEVRTASHCEALIGRLLRYFQCQ